MHGDITVVEPELITANEKNISFHTLVTIDLNEIVSRILRVQRSKAGILGSDIRTVSVLVSLLRVRAAEL